LLRLKSLASSIETVMPLCNVIKEVFNFCVQ